MYIVCMNIYFLLVSTHQKLKQVCFVRSDAFFHTNRVVDNMLRESGREIVVPYKLIHTYTTSKQQGTGGLIITITNV